MTEATERERWCHKTQDAPTSATSPGNRSAGSLRRPYAHKRRRRKPSAEGAGQPTKACRRSTWIVDATAEKERSPAYKVRTLQMDSRDAQTKAQWQAEAPEIRASRRQHDKRLGATRPPSGAHGRWLGARDALCLQVQDLNRDGGLLPSSNPPTFFRPFPYGVPYRPQCSRSAYSVPYSALPVLQVYSGGYRCKVNYIVPVYYLPEW